jgi:hypothetical protein
MNQNNPTAASLIVPQQPHSTTTATLGRLRCNSKQPHSSLMIPRQPYSDAAAASWCHSNLVAPQRSHEFTHSQPLTTASWYYNNLMIPQQRHDPIAAAWPHSTVTRQKAVHLRQPLPLDEKSLEQHSKHGGVESAHLKLDHTSTTHAHPCNIEPVNNTTVSPANTYESTPIIIKKILIYPTQKKAVMRKIQVNGGVENAPLQAANITTRT